MFMNKILFPHFHVHFGEEIREIQNIFSLKKMYSVFSSERIHI